MTEYIQPTLSNFRCEKDFYTVREIAEISKVSTSTIRSWILKGYLKGEMREPVSAKAKTMRGRYRVYPAGLLDDIELHRAELMEISMRSWPVLLAKLNKKKEHIERNGAACKLYICFLYTSIPERRMWHAGGVCITPHTHQLKDSATKR